MHTAPVTVTKLTLYTIVYPGCDFQLVARIFRIIFGQKIHYFRQYTLSLGGLFLWRTLYLFSVIIWYVVFIGRNCFGLSEQRISICSVLIEQVYKRMSDLQITV